MKIKGIFFLPSILAIMGLTSCYNDKADLLYPNTGANAVCDTASAISYSQRIVPLLQQYCYGCHIGSGGTAMGTYAADRALALNGKLYGTISYANGFTQMPQGGSKLSDCQIGTINKWVKANSPNN